ncbi:MAG: hypothetical protein EON54_28820 [Alcaligenaceae bacterium]|nr:MAG: hypothetical protein EON54_28820 [Alcaligenaceae bacterium]
MGTNRRYADAIDARMNERALQVVARSGKLQSLSSLELRLDEVPLTIDPQPHRRIKAWVRFGDTPVRVDAVAARWTSDAVGIVFFVGEKELRCWVWNGAVEELV